MIWRSILYDWADGIFLYFIIPIVFWGFISLFRFRRDKLQSFASIDVLDVIVIKRLPIVYMIKSCLFVFIWGCVAMALMQPKGNGKYTSDFTKQDLSLKEQSRQKAHEVILLLDVSASMAVPDLFGQSTRFEYAKNLADNIISRLNGENVSLYAFTSSLIQIVPSTNDYLFTRLMLRHLNVDEGETQGTDLAFAFSEVGKLFRDQPVDIIKSLIVLSDGGDTLYETKDLDQEHLRLVEILKPIDDYPKIHMQVLAVGIGSKDGGVVPKVVYKDKPVTSVLEAALMQKISVVGQGQYYSAQDTPINLLGAQVMNGITQQAKTFKRESQDYYEQSVQENSKLIYDEYFQIPLGIALFAFIFMLSIPDTGLKRGD